MDLLAIAFTLAAASSAPAPVDPVAARECREAGDFVKNAALSRDAGMTREAFLQRLHDDFAAIRGLPRQLRWFVQSPEDEVFLAGEVERVFDVPDAGQAHRERFISRCLQRLRASG